MVGREWWFQTSGITLVRGTHCCQRAIAGRGTNLGERPGAGAGAGAPLRPDPVAGRQSLGGPRFLVTTLVQSLPGSEAFILSPGQWPGTRASL